MYFWFTKVLYTWLRCRIYIRYIFVGLFSRLSFAEWSQSTSSASYLEKFTTQWTCGVSGPTLHHPGTFIYSYPVNSAETNCGIAHILGILLMNSYDT